MKMIKKKINSSLVANLYEKYTGPEVAKKLRVSKSFVYRRLRKLNVKIRNNSAAQKFRLMYHKIEGRPKIKVKTPTTNSEKISEAYVIGALMGDGYITKHMARLCVTQKDFMLEFAKCIKNAYGVSPSKKEYKKYGRKNVFVCTTHRALVSKRIIKLTNNMSKIPNFVLNGNKNVKGAFIRGFADSEGSVDVTNNRHQIVITQKGTKRLESLQNLLLSLSIQSKIYKKSSNANHLVVSLLRNLKKFKEIVGFSIAYKNQKLKEAIDYLEKINVSDLYWKVLRSRINADKSSQKLANKLGLKPATFRSWVTNRRVPRQIKKDLEYNLVPKDYESLRRRFRVLPKVKQIKHLHH